MNVLRGRGLVAGLLVMALSVTACSVDRPAVAGSAAAPASAPDSPPLKSVSPPPSATPSAPLEASPVLQSPDPAADARAALQDPDLERPALEYPNLQSYGAAVISFSSPDRPAVVGGLSCLWAPGGEYSEPGVVALKRFSVVLAGEQAEIWLGPPMTFGDSLEFAIHRHGAASYVPGPGTGSVVFPGANDWSSGTMRFDNLAPSPETAPPLTSSPAEWIGPLGGDAAMARLTGTVAWACEPPPASLSEYARSRPYEPPLYLGDPAPIVLVVDDQRKVGEDACGGFSGDTCGPPLYVLPADLIVSVPSGHLLRFDLPEERFHFVKWSLQWARQSDAQRWQDQYEWNYEGPYEDEAWKLIDKGVLSESSSLEFDAPPPGDWSVVLHWTDDRDDQGGNIASYFRVVVQ